MGGGGEGGGGLNRSVKKRLCYKACSYSNCTSNTFFFFTHVGDSSRSKYTTLISFFILVIVCWFFQITLAEYAL